MANKLELTWVGKDKQIKIEPRLLIENAALSNTAKDKNTENMLIHGDNLLALKALEQKFAGQVKCIYIDPPYNTGKAFEQYDDNIEHSIWLNLMFRRLLILKSLLSDDGVIFVQINDDEASYLKVMLDEIFGRNNYETTFYVKVRHENRILREDTRYQLVIEQVLCYSKSKDKYHPVRRDKEKDANMDYEYEIEILESPKSTIDLGGYIVDIYDTNQYSIKNVGKGKGKLKRYSIRGSLITQKGSASEFYEKFLRERKAIDGLGTLYRVKGMGLTGDGLGYRDIIQPDKEKLKNGVYFQGKPLKTKVNKGLPYYNFFDRVDLYNNAGYEGGIVFRGGKKPEAWLKELFYIAGISKNDIVLDSFLGSGSTAATCHKLGIKYIGVELGDHAYTHCKVRLDKVIEGEQGGISKDVNWQGGGGYRFYELAPTLINKDDLDEEIINTDYNADMLAAAVALHEGFRYEPDGQVFWKQSKGTENSYLFVTTKHITRAYLTTIAATMDANEHLVIACKTFDKNVVKAYKNIVVKKIPEMLLNRCEFGKDDYNLNIINPPVYEEDGEE